MRPVTASKTVKESASKQSESPWSSLKSVCERRSPAMAMAPGTQIRKDGKERRPTDLASCAATCPKHAPAKTVHPIAAPSHGPPLHPGRARVYLQPGSKRVEDQEAGAGLDPSRKRQHTRQSTADIVPDSAPDIPPC